MRTGKEQTWAEAETDAHSEWETETEWLRGKKDHAWNIAMDFFCT